MMRAWGMGGRLYTYPRPTIHVTKRKCVITCIRSPPLCGVSLYQSGMLPNLKIGKKSDARSPVPISKNTYQVSSAF